VTGALLPARPDLPNANLKICDETLPVFDGQMRFDIVLTPNGWNATRPMGIPALRRCVELASSPIAGYKFMASHEDAFEAWLVPVLTTGL
jgi:hypothetical protein